MAEKTKQETTTEEVVVENVLERKNPLWAFGNNRLEIRNIAEMAGESLESVLPDIDFRTHCVAIPCTVLCFMNELLNQLNRIKLETKQPVTFQFGNLMTLEIEQRSFRCSLCGYGKRVGKDWRTGSSEPVL